MASDLAQYVQTVLLPYVQKRIAWSSLDGHSVNEEHVLRVMYMCARVSCTTLFHGCAVVQDLNMSGVHKVDVHAASLQMLVVVGMCI